MYSKDIHEAIVKAYETVEKYEQVLSEHMERFDIPKESKVSVSVWDTTEVIVERFREVPREVRDHIWVLGALTEATDLRFPVMNHITEAVREMKTGGEMPGGETTLHLIGTKPSIGIIHPRYLQKFESGKYKLPNGERLPYYAESSEMVEITMVFKTDVIMLGGMRFTWSNFNGAPVAIKLKSMGLVYRECPWKLLFSNTPIQSTEHVIQMAKVYASLSLKHKIVGEEACRLSLLARSAKLAEVGFQLPLDMPAVGALCVEFESTKHETYESLNGHITGRLCERMLVATDPAKIKLLGNACGLNGASYFGIMNGAVVDPLNPDYAKVGNNARVMACGVLLRLHLGDDALIESMEFCRKYNVRVFEMAVHGKNSFGDMADESWGVAPCSARMSPLAFKVEGKCFSAFGNGVNAVLDAMHGDKAAQTFLGIDSPLETLGEIRDAVVASFARAIATIEF